MRLLSSRHGWWLRASNKVVLLPPEALNARGELDSRADHALRRSGVLDPCPSDTYYVTVLTSTACNLGCGYCFQNTAQAQIGRHNPPRIKAAQLRPDTVSKILDFADTRMTASGTTKLHILLFGGEPLLNPAGCLNLLRAAANHGLVGANMISNGVLLRVRLARQLAAAGLRRVKITFDGGRDAHDAIRTTRGGGATYDIITKNVAAATSATDLMWDIRVNISHQNAATITDLIEDLSERLEPDRCSFDFSLVDDVGIGYNNDLSYADGMVRKFIDWNLQALQLGFDISPIAGSSTCAYCSTQSGATGAVINADGVLYSCWKSAGKQGWEVGDVSTGYLPRAVIEPRWVACNYDQADGQGQQDVQEFFNQVDAAVLDWRYDNNRL